MAAPAPLGAPSSLATTPCLAGSKAVGLGTFGGHGGDAHGWEAKLEAVSICPNCSIFPRKTDQPLFRFPLQRGDDSPVFLESLRGT